MIPVHDVVTIEIDVARLDAGAGERLGGHLLSERDGVVAIEALHLAEPARVSQRRERLDAEAALDRGVIEQLHHRVELAGRAAGAARAAAPSPVLGGAVARVRRWPS